MPEAAGPDRSQAGQRPEPAGLLAGQAGAQAGGTVACDGTDRAAAGNDTVRVALRGVIGVQKHAVVRA